MPRQTFIWTALPNGVVKLGGRGNQPRLGLKLSVFVTPRLHDDLGAPPRQMQLSEFPDVVDWPGTLQRLVASQIFIVRVDGVPVTGVSIQLPDVGTGSELWKALFPPATRVDPFVFDDYSSAQTATYPAGALAQRIREGYVDATEPAAGGGVNLLAAVEMLRRVIFQHLPALPLGLPQPAGVPGLPVIPILPGLLGSLPGQVGTVPVIIGPPTPEIPRLPGLPGLPDIPGVGVPVIVGPPTPETPGLPVPPVAGLPGPPIIIGPPTPKLPVDPRLLQRFLEFHRPPAGGPPTPPDERNLRELFDFHQMVAVLGDHPAVLRRLGLIIDLVAPLPLDLAEIVLPFRRVRVEPVWVPRPDPLGNIPTVNHSPDTACVLRGDLFVAAPRGSDPETNDGLLRLQDRRYQLEQFDIDGAIFKLQGQQKTVKTVVAGLSPTMPPDTALPALRTAGITALRDDRDAQLAQIAQGAARRNKLLEAAERALVDPDPGDPMFAEEVSIGFRVDVWDDVSKRWRSLHRRETTYTVPRRGNQRTPASFSNDDEEGFVELCATERASATPGAPRTFFVSPSVFTWEGWSLSTPRPGRQITNPVEGEQPAPPKNDLAQTALRLTTKTNAIPNTLPRLRIGRTYRFRARMADLAGNSRPLFQDQPDRTTEVTAALPFCRFEPVSSPIVVLAHGPMEGESVERLVCRSDPGDPPLRPAKQDIERETAERHLAPPTVAQLLAELHGAFDDTGGGTMKGDAATHTEISSRDKATLVDADLPGIEIITKDLNKKDLATPMVAHHAAQLRVPYLPDPAAHGVLLSGLPGARPRTMPDSSIVGLTHVPFAGSWPDVLPFRLHLVGIDAGRKPAEPRLDPKTNTLVVQLPQAEIATVRISCSLFKPPNDGETPAAAMTTLRTMGVWRWIEDLAPVDQRDRLRREALQGRNWMLTPYREITLVHAVQRPVEAPQPLDPQLVVSRLPGDTRATVDAVVRVHGPSTAKVELLADWTDCVDNPAAGNPHPVTTSALLGQRDVTRGDRDVQMPQARPDFGDTKHHVVTFRALATSSFREYFSEFVDKKERKKEPPERRIFSRPSVDTPGVLRRDVPSSARPLAPRVLYAVPIFSWDRTPGRSVRTARGLRVYMERPWYSSGNDEKLAVVFVPGPPGPDSDPRTALTTTWGTDPVWESRAVPDLAARHFVGRKGEKVQVLGGLTLEELPGGQTVSAAVYDVAYDAGREVWFSDVTFDVASHFPFVRLALARFQPFSLPGLELSRVAVLPFAQLPPDRVALLTPLKSDQPGLKRQRLQLSGVAGRNAEVQTRLDVTVLKQGKGGMDWVVDVDGITATSTENPPNRTWTADFAYPDDSAVRRLFIQEIETYGRP